MKTDKVQTSFEFCLRQLFNGEVAETKTTVMRITIRWAERMASQVWPYGHMMIMMMMVMNHH